MKKYEDFAWGVEDRDEFVAELTADGVETIEVFKMGDGSWLIVWEEA